MGSCFFLHTIPGWSNWKPKLNDRLQSLLPRNVLLNIISFSVAAAPSGRQTTICDELSDGISESSRGPVYKETILVTKKHRADFYIFGHFLPRLSRNECSQVLSMGKFGPTAPDFGYNFPLYFLLYIVGWL